MKVTPSDPVNYTLVEGDLGSDYREFLDVVTNVPDSPALVPVAISRAGITQQSVYLHLPVLGGHERVPVLCEVEAASSLESRRGVHMSRFEECIFEIAASSDYDSLDGFVSLVAQAAREKQASEETVVSASGAMLVPRTTKVSKRTSHDRVTLIAEAKCTANATTVFTAVRAFNVTACPCTRAFTKFSVVPALIEKGYRLDQVREILDTVLTGTHLQRGTVCLKVEKTSKAVTSELLFAILEQATHLVFDLLKRPDEHELVIRALRRPQFTEDVARDVALAAFRQLGELVPPRTVIEVLSVLQDSIHIHDVFTELRTTAGDLRMALQTDSLP